MKIIDNIKKNTIFILLITVVVLYFLLKDDFDGVMRELSNMKVLYILLGLLFFLASVMIKGYVNYKIINEKDKVSKKEAISQNFIAQFFNGITPFATGGEPMGVYMLMEQGISFPKATNYMVQSFVFYQVALVIMGFFAVTYNWIFNIFPKDQFLKHLVLIGFIINILIVVVLLLSYYKKVQNFLCNMTIKITKKFKKSANEEEIKQKFEDYHNGFVTLKKRKKLIIAGIGLNIIGLCCLYLVPYWVIKGMGIEDAHLVNTIVASAYVYLIGGFVPIPGGSGGMEFGFNEFFSNLITPGVIPAVIIVWRALTYYLGIIIGAILFNVRKKG